jgi:uncharacterized protein YoaH (UPF0181 family)
MSDEEQFVTPMALFARDGKIVAEPLPPRRVTADDEWRNAKAHFASGGNPERGMAQIRQLLAKDEPIPPQGHLLLAELFESVPTLLRTRLVARSSWTKQRQKKARRIILALNIKLLMAGGMSKADAIKKFAKEGDLPTAAQQVHRAIRELMSCSLQSRK